MSVDIYVMPLGRFKSGDFESPLQRVFGAENVTRVTRAGIKERPEPETISEALELLVAADEVSFVRRFLDRAALELSLEEKVLQWTDEGETQFAEQAVCLEAATTYASWLSYRDQYPVFEVPDPEGFEAHPVWGLVDDQSNTKHPHLALHDHCVGYYLPCEFPRLLRMPTGYDGYPEQRAIGSSYRLRDELTEVGATLELSWKSGVGLVDEYGERDAVRAQVVSALLQLSRAAEASCQHGLPIIFDG